MSQMAKLAMEGAPGVMSFSGSSTTLTRKSLLAGSMYFFSREEACSLNAASLKAARGRSMFHSRSLELVAVTMLISAVKSLLVAGLIFMTGYKEDGALLAGLEAFGGLVG